MYPREKFIRLSRVLNEIGRKCYIQGLGERTEYLVWKKEAKDSNAVSHVVCFKVTVSRDFLLLVFFMNQFPPPPPPYSIPFRPFRIFSKIRGYS
jgi:hypothetical protein